jgi:hypothetical protein
VCSSESDACLLRYVCCLGVAVTFLGTVCPACSHARLSSKPGVQWALLHEKSRGVLGEVSHCYTNCIRGPTKPMRTSSFCSTSQACLPSCSHGRCTTCSSAWLRA